MYLKRHFHQVFFKIGKTAKETYQLLQQAYGEDAVGRSQVFDCFHSLKRVEPPLKATPARDDRQLLCYGVNLDSRILAKILYTVDRSDMPL